MISASDEVRLRSLAGENAPVTADDRQVRPVLARAAVPAFLPLLGTWIGSLFSRRRMRPEQPRPAWGKPEWLLAGAVAAILAIVAAMVFLDGVAIAGQRRLSPSVIDTFDTITDLGRAGWVLTPLALLLLILAVLSSRPLDRITQLVLTSVAVRVGYLFTAIAVPGLVVTIVKRMIGRARPYSWELGGPFDFVPFNWKVEYASLPSGHGTTAFATAIAVGALFPRLRIPMWTFAVLVAISRVVVSAHYPSDVIAGGCIGVLGAIAVRNWFATRRLGFVISAERTVTPMAGPSPRRLTAALRKLVGR